MADMPLYPEILQCVFSKGKYFFLQCDIFKLWVCIEVEGFIIYLAVFPAL